MYLTLGEFLKCYVFVKGFFLGFVGSPRDFLGGFDFTPIRSSPILEMRSTLWGLKCHVKGLPMRRCHGNAASPT